MSVGSIESSKLTTNKEIVVPAMLPNSVAPPVDNSLEVSVKDAIVDENGTPVGTIEAMRSIINDRRYVALRSLGEWKQAFAETCIWDRALRYSKSTGFKLSRSSRFIFKENEIIVR